MEKREGLESNAVGELIETLEALREHIMRENKELLDLDRRKNGYSYFEGKIAGIELALDKARAIERRPA